MTQAFVRMNKKFAFNSKDLWWTLEKQKQRDLLEDNCHNLLWGSKWLVCKWKQWDGDSIYAICLVSPAVGFAERMQVGQRKRIGLREAPKFEVWAPWWLVVSWIGKGLGKSRETSTYKPAVFNVLCLTFPMTLSYFLSVSVSWEVDHSSLGLLSQLLLGNRKLHNIQQ